MDDSSKDIWSNRLVLALLYTLTFLSFGLGFIVTNSVVSTILCLPDIFTGNLTSDPFEKFSECYRGVSVSVVPVISGVVFGFIAMYPSYKIIYEVLFGDKYIRTII